MFKMTLIQRVCSKKSYLHTSPLFTHVHPPSLFVFFFISLSECLGVYNTHAHFSPACLLESTSNYDYKACFVFPIF